jgi:hypothetical protein
MEIEVDKGDLKRINNSLSSLPEDIQESNEKGLSAFGFFVSGQISDYIEGNFSSISILASKYKNDYFRDYKGNKSNPWRRRILKNKGAFFFLSKFAKYINYGDSVKVSYTNRQGVKRKKFDKDLLRIAKRMERGATYKVTPKMRRFVALSGKPLKASTKQIKVKKRPVIRPVFNASKNSAIDIYKRQVTQKLSKDNDLYEK